MQKQKPLPETKGTKQEQEGSTEEDTSPSLFLEEKEDPDKINDTEDIYREQPKNLGTLASGYLLDEITSTQTGGVDRLWLYLFIISMEVFCYK